MLWVTGCLAPRSGQRSWVVVVWRWWWCEGGGGVKVVVVWWWCGGGVVVVWWWGQFDIAEMWATQRCTQHCTRNWNIKGQLWPDTGYRHGTTDMGQQTQDIRLWDRGQLTERHRTTDEWAHNNRLIGTGRQTNRHRTKIDIGQLTNIHKTTDKKAQGNRRGKTSDKKAQNNIHRTTD